MKKILHNISIRVFEKKSENIEDIKKVFKQILPIDFKKEKIIIKKETVEGLNQKTINIIHIKTSKKRHNKMILDNIFNNLDDKDKNKLYQEKNKRIDQKGNFYIRLDKKQLIKNIYKITDGGDCFHFTIKIAAYPLNKEKINEALELLFENMGYKKK